MKEFEKFGRKIKNVDPEEFKAIIAENTPDDCIYQVQDLEDRFRYAVHIKDKSYSATFYVYNGMQEAEERKAFTQVAHTLTTGWYPIVDEKGHGWACALCGSSAGDLSVVNFPCPCRK